ncbi:hypothetical protein [Methylotetracoccus oryzae]|uniref:hypothetical protein n=1 Tax=Methylotetracoccus oryzae TaxID=1919059 RepID=UPI0013A5498C|nr:hypothetical protein [Methylotetracoccus oryzae]
MRLFRVFGDALRWVIGAIGDEISGAATAAADTIETILRSLFIRCTACSASLDVCSP